MRPEFRVKDLFCHFFAAAPRMNFGKMYFRIYNPKNDTVVNKFQEKDWRMIFFDTDETDIRELSQCIDVTILMWCDSVSGQAHGILYFQEDHLCPGSVCVHGGTWNHSPAMFGSLFDSLIHVYAFLVHNQIEVHTSCVQGNDVADKMQDRLGFVETHRDDNVVYKTLNEELFFKSQVVCKFLNNDKAYG